MDIKIFNTEGQQIAERNYFPGTGKSKIEEFLKIKGPEIYLVNIIYDKIEKTRKLKIR